MAYSIIAQNNSTTTLADENGNVITVPSRSILEAGTTFTLVKINNNTATLEDSNGKVYRDIPCCIDLTQVTGFNVTKVNNNKATLEDGDGKVYAGVPCIVNLTESGGTITSLNVTPSTSAQTITATGGTDGYSPVNVSAVDASIDANITAGNIKSGVTILGVTGNVVELNGETKTVTPQVYGQTLYPTSPKNAITEITVNAVTSSIDANIQAGNIKKDVTILGVTGTYEAGGGSGMTLEFERTEDPDSPGYYLLKHSTTAASIMNITQPTCISSQEYMFYNAYNGNTAITGTVDLSNIIEVIGSINCFAKTFYGCTGITKIDISSCTNGDSSYTSVANLTFNYFAQNATSLQEVDFSKMIRIDGFNTSFSGCTSLVTVKLDSLSNIGNVQNGWQYAFRNTALTELKLPAFRTRGSRVNQFNNMFSGVANVTLHCPANMQSSVEAMTGYSTTAPFGATAGTVLFDLPSTFLLTGADGYTYERNPHFDTPSALSWRRTNDYDTYNWRINWNNPYYTSGTTDPSVSDTIYSDSACTTPATTIDSIA